MIVGNGKAGDGGLGVRGVAPDAEIWFYATAPPSEDDSVNCAAQQPQESTTDLTIAAPASMHSIAPDLEAIADGMWEAEAMAALDAIRNGADIISISDRKSTRLNSSHVATSYAVCCLKKTKFVLLFDRP